MKGEQIHPQCFIIRSSFFFFLNPPDEGFIKINRDGAYAYASQIAAAGSILRDHSGYFLSAVACNLGSYSIVEAELWAIFHGLKLAISRCFSRMC